MAWGSGSRDRGQPAAIGPGVERAGALGRAGRSVTLDLAGGGHAGGDFGAALGRRRQGEIGGGDRRGLHH